ncbi:MAG: arabinose operon regulatory protein [Paenibacillaceae bacterium]|nr:arabinose operon regulatory protein [Paenibacillaceae bacterium]
MPQLADVNLLDKIHIQARWVAEWNRATDWEIHGIVSPATIIWFVLEGCKTLRADDQELRLQAGDLVILPPHVSISVDRSPAEEGELRHLAIGLDWKAGSFDFVKIYRFPLVLGPLEGEHREELVAQWRGLVADFDRLQRDEAMTRDVAEDMGGTEGEEGANRLFYNVDQSYRLISCNARLYQLTALFIQLLRPQLPAFPLSLDARVYKACEYIHTNAGAKVSAEAIARHVYLSEPHLRTLFREALGMPLMEYVRQARISRARELLSMTRCSLKEIAEQLGFEDQSQLSRAFRKAEGLSPLSYRKRWQLL